MTQIQAKYGQPAVYRSGAITLNDGEAAALPVDVNGNVLVNVAAGSSGGLSIVDEASWTAGVSNFVPSGGVFNDSAAALTSGQQGTERLTPNRAQHSNLRNNAGTEVGTSTTPLQVSLANTAANATAVKVDGSAVTQPVSGTVTAVGTSASLFTGQATSNGATPVQITAGSHALSNGIIVKSLSTNNASGVYVGLTGVATTTGDLIEPGESRGYAVNNTNLLYIVTAASTTDVVTFSAN